MRAARQTAGPTDPMMRRIELLPPRFAQRRRDRRNVGFVALGGTLLLVALLAWWFMLGTRLAQAEDRLAEVQARNDGLQAEIAELQRFADLRDEVVAKEVALAAVFAGDVDWPSLLGEVAMVVPGEVWLTSLTASAGQVEGAAPVGTETAAVRLAEQEPFGRIQFTGSALSLPGVGKWLLRQQSMDEFSAVWLNSATKEESAAEAGSTDPAATSGVEIVTFDSTLELTPKAASLRFASGTIDERDAAGNPEDRKQ